MSWGPTEIQKAVFLALNGNAALTAKIGANKVFDFIPDRQAFPYVAVGDATFIDRGSHNTEGWTVDIEIDVWSRGRGRKECHEICDLISTALHNVNLSVAGHSVLSLRRDNIAVLVDPDAVTYHGAMRFRCLLAET